MTMGGRWIVVLCTLAVLSCVALALFGGNDKRVLLRDLSAITLYSGRMTQGRRSSPVQQLNCVGGSARGAFVPQVVQCRNVGFDGTDVQWECKTDMDNAYRFGTVEVSCEGFDYPDDPYVLAGSCGLEYTLDLTKEGHQQKHQQHQYYGNEHQEDYHDRSSSYYQSSYKKGMSGLSSLFMLGIAVCVMYFIYKTCLAGPTPAPGASGSAPDPPPYSYQDPSQGGRRVRAQQWGQHVRILQQLRDTDSFRVRRNQEEIICMDKGEITQYFQQALHPFS